MSLVFRNQACLAAKSVGRLHVVWRVCRVQCLRQAGVHVRFCPVARVRVAVTLLQTKHILSHLANAPHGAEASLLRTRLSARGCESVSEETYRAAKAPLLQTHFVRVFVIRKVDPSGVCARRRRMRRITQRRYCHV